MITGSDAFLPSPVVVAYPKGELNDIIITYLKNPPEVDILKKNYDITLSEKQTQIAKYPLNVVYEPIGDLLS